MRSDGGACRRWKPVLAIGLLVALGAGPAQAAPKSLNGFVGGESSVNTGGLFTQSSDVVVYTGTDSDPANDKIFVVEAVDDNDSRVQRLDADGNFERVWGKDVIAEGPGDTGTGFEICTVAERCKGGDKGGLGGELDDPVGIAVNQVTGQLYVMDRDNRRVQQFDLDGGFVRAWGWDVVQAGAPGDTGTGFEVCALASACQRGSAGGGAGQLDSIPFATSGVAVSPVAPFDVFVADPANQRVQQFSANGGFVRAWGFGVDTGASQFEACTAVSVCQAGSTAAGSENGHFSIGQPRHLAIDADGVVYASDANASNRVVRFDSDLAPVSGNASAALLEPLPSPGLLIDARTVGLEADPVSGHLFVARYEGPADPVVQEIADPGAPLSGGPPNPTVVDNHVFAIESPINLPVINGIGYDPADGNLLLVTTSLFVPPDGIFTGCEAAGSSCDGLIVLAETAGPAQGIANAPTDVGATTAEVSGTVDPGGGIATYRIQVSRDGVEWVDASPPRYLSGSSSAAVSAQVTGLEPNTLYRLRLIVRKQVGMDETETVTSAEQIVVTDALPPDVQTLGSARRTSTGAQLRGLVDPNNASTTYRFEYGLEGDSFDRVIPVPDGSAGAGGSPKLVLEEVTGLQPDTAYQYRLVATNFIGTTVGDVVTFRTRDDAEPPPPPGERRYELVSPADKLGGQGAGNWYNGPASHAFVGHGAHGGERFAVRGDLGSVLTDGEYAYASDWALAERTPSGWVHQPAMTRTPFGRQSARFLNMADATEDLSMILFGSNAGLLRLFEELENWNEPQIGNALYVRDWVTGKWEIVGPTDPAQGGGNDALEGRSISEDATHVVGSSILRGLAGPDDPALDAVAGARNVYLDELPDGPSDTFPGSGERSLVNVCTDGTEIPEVLASGKLGARQCPPALPGRSAPLIDSRGASVGLTAERALDRVISPSGDRIFFMSPDPQADVSPCAGLEASTACPPQLYVRQRDGDDVVTRWISRSEVSDQDASLLAPVTFEGASSDGDKVFFRTAAPLTEDDPNGSVPVPGGVKTGDASLSSVDLYMYDFPDDRDDDPAGGDLVRISAGPTGAGDGNVSHVGPTRSGAVRFVSEDGGRVYFTSAAPLPGVPAPSSGTITSPAGARNTTSDANLYLYDAANEPAQRWRFVARLPRLTTLGPCATTETSTGASLTGTASRGPQVEINSSSCVRGSSDGSFLTFWTDGRLTLDDPDAVSGDVYAYDATAEELTRISEPQGGAGGTYECAPGTSAVRCYGDGGLGVSGAALFALGVATDPLTPGDRMAFFQSRSRLVADDTDSAYDVYQWRNGELSLISVGGDDPDGFFYQGNDRTGRSVFFSTRDRMTWQDRDSVLDVYVARVGGGFPEPAPPQECSLPADACQGPGPSESPSNVDRGTSGSNAVGRRIDLALSAPGRKARARAARSGILALRVKTSGAGTISASAKARLKGRSRRVARARAEASKAGNVTLRLRLSRAARQRLRSGRALRLTVTVKADGARTRTATVKLKRGRR
jgi:hypothetical protein